MNAWDHPETDFGIITNSPHAKSEAGMNVAYKMLNAERMETGEPLCCENMACRCIVEYPVSGYEFDELIVDENRTRTVCRIFCCDCSVRVENGEKIFVVS